VLEPAVLVEDLILIVRPSLLCLLVFVVPLHGLNFSLAQAVDAQDRAKNVRLATESHTQLNLTVEDAYGRVLLFDFGDSFRMNVTIRPDEISWTELGDGGRTETDTAHSIKLDEHRLMMSWIEESGQFVVMYADFLEGESSFCGLRRPGLDKQGTCYTGTMAVAE
jgi:hypothetical protein